MTASAYYPRAAVTLTLLLEGETEPRSYAVIPQSVEVERNDHRHADTALVVVDYRDLPLDPRAVRSILVEVLLGDIRDPTLTAVPTTRSWRRFIGYVDEPETTLEESGETVRLQCRDYTALFCDYEWPGTAIDVSGPLTTVIATIIEAVPGASSLPVVFDASGSADLVLAGYIGRTKFAPHAKDDAWTVLVDLLSRAGLIPVIILDELHVLSAKDVSGARAVRMLYGRNIARLSWLRKFNEAATQQIEVRAWDEVSRTARTGRYPAAAITTRRKVSTTGKVSTEKAPILAFYVAGTYSEAQLTDIAEAIYAEVGREQFEGSLETAEMLDLDDVELPGLANGDTLAVRLDSGVLASIEGMSEAEAVAFLSGSDPRRPTPAQPLDATAAAALVSVARRMDDTASSFYVKSARHRWSRGQGYSLEVTFISFVGAR